MHLVPADRRKRRIIEDDRVCNAIAAIGDPERVNRLAQRFSLLADPTRLTLLLCMYFAGPISVSDLAAAADLNDTTVSQALRLLKSGGTVSSHRDGQIVRYEVSDPSVAALLADLGTRAPVPHRHPHTQKPARRRTDRSA